MEKDKEQEPLKAEEEWERDRDGGTQRYLNMP